MTNGVIPDTDEPVSPLNQSFVIGVILIRWHAVDASVGFRPIYLRSDLGRKLVARDRAARARRHRKCRRREPFGPDQRDGASHTTTARGSDSSITRWARTTGATARWIANRSQECGWSWDKPSACRVKL